ncbi:sorbitol dehydrogenase [Acrocarpospora corrugata]|uniref:Sorbitol dehydrogenase n=1 Tax=Acrocarpospora corrugata TaxID=35763 RepID=A0A5M3WAZ3_9ACTN|nr:alcohol dehydrogenase catalytic domain-containing protein [Acrocarpospora corrugata]GES04221.1 sorbitol dehydrogenase [Acrocarpospora corrugata]
MRASRLHGVADIRLNQEPSPEVGPGMSLVRVTAVGLCGSDLHWYAEGGIGDATITRPLVVGHEFAGVIEGGPAHGRRVAVDPAIPCEKCANCRSGYRNLCPYVRFAGHDQLDGGLQELISWPTELLHALPDGLSDSDGAMLEPLGVALHAFDLSHLHLGGTVAVVGCGPIGLLLIQLARLAGASTITAVEPLPHRAEAARRFGAVLTETTEADVVFEVAGNDTAVDTALELARPGGRVVLVGIPDGDHTSFRASLARRKGLTLALVRRMNDVYPRAIRLVEEGRVNVSSLVSARYPLAEAPKAFAAAIRRQGLKIVIEPQR